MKKMIGKLIARSIALLLFLACFAAVSLAGAAEVKSADEIKNSDQSPCYPVFKNETSPAYLCKRCEVYIHENASLDDRRALMRDFAAQKCEFTGEAYPEHNRTGRSIFIDQDLFYPPRNDDRNYTMGVGLSFSGDHFKRDLLARPRDMIDRLVSLHTGSNPIERIHAREFGVTAFTPNDIEAQAPIPGDRPYASLVYLSNSKLTAYNDDHAVKSRFVVGVLGLGVARTVQRFLHNNWNFSDQDPRGWSNQISDGGEPTLLYSAERIKLLNEDTVGTRNWDLSFTVGANAGYYTDAYAGIDARLGFAVASPYYAHNANPLSTFNHANCVTCSKNDAYVFISLRERAVGYNALLQGQFRDSTVEIPARDVKRLLHEGTAGFTVPVPFCEKWKLTYTISYRSKEYTGSEERTHWFSGVYIAWNKF